MLVHRAKHPAFALLHVRSRDRIDQMGITIEMTTLQSVPARQKVPVEDASEEGLERLIYRHALRHDLPSSDDKLPGAIFQINRMSSRIAHESRRGRGNVVYIHPVTLFEIGLYDRNNAMLRDLPIYLYQARAWMPRNEVMCAYVGTHVADSPAAYFEGHLYLNFDANGFSRVLVSDIFP